MSFILLQQRVKLPTKTHYQKINYLQRVLELEHNLQKAKITQRCVRKNRLKTFFL